MNVTFYWHTWPFPEWMQHNAKTRTVSILQDNEIGSSAEWDFIPFILLSHTNHINHTWKHGKTYLFMDLYDQLSLTVCFFCLMNEHSDRLAFPYLSYGGELEPRMANNMFFLWILGIPFESTFKAAHKFRTVKKCRNPHYHHRRTGSMRKSGVLASPSQRVNAKTNTWLWLDSLPST